MPLTFVQLDNGHTQADAKPYGAMPSARDLANAPEKYGGSGGRPHVVPLLRP